MRGPRCDLTMPCMLFDTFQRLGTGFQRRDRPAPVETKEKLLDRWERAMVGCWVALLFSLEDPYLWIISSRHRQTPATLEIGHSGRLVNSKVTIPAFCVWAAGTCCWGPLGLGRVRQLSGIQCFLSKKGSAACGGSAETPELLNTSTPPLLINNLNF